MHCYGELEPPDGDLWLCQLCQEDAPKVPPRCCLCPVTGGAMKPTNDGRWAHLTCAIWIPGKCLLGLGLPEHWERNASNGALFGCSFWKYLL